jgi:hypothetical protein
VAPADHRPDLFSAIQLFAILTIWEIAQPFRKGLFEACGKQLDFHGMGGGLSPF